MTKTNFQHRVKLYPLVALAVLAIPGCSPQSAAPVTPTAVPVADRPPAWQRKGEARVQIAMESSSPNRAAWEFVVETTRDSKSSRTTETSESIGFGPPSTKLNTFKISMVLERPEKGASKITVTNSHSGVDSDGGTFNGTSTTSHEIELPKTGKLFEMLEVGFDQNAIHLPFPIKLLTPKKGSKLNLSLDLELYREKSR